MKCRCDIKTCAFQQSSSLFACQEIKSKLSISRFEYHGQYQNSSSQKSIGHITYRVFILHSVTLSLSGGTNVGDRGREKPSLPLQLLTANLLTALIYQTG